MGYEDRIRIMDCGCHYDSVSGVTTAFCERHDAKRCPECRTPHRFCRRCVTDGGPDDLFVSNAAGEVRRNAVTSTGLLADESKGETK